MLPKFKRWVSCIFTPFYRVISCSLCSSCLRIFPFILYVANAYRAKFIYQDIFMLLLMNAKHNSYALKIFWSCSDSDHSCGSYPNRWKARVLNEQSTTLALRVRRRRLFAETSIRVHRTLFSLIFLSKIWPLICNWRLQDSLFSWSSFKIGRTKTFLAWVSSLSLKDTTWKIGAHTAI